MTEVQFTETGYIILAGIELDNMPEYVQVEECRMQKKEEFHITIVGAKALTYLPTNVNANDEMRKAVSSFMNLKSLTQFTLKDEFRLVKRGERATIIQMVELHGIEKLYDYLNDTFNIDLPLQPAHITIYSLDPKVGISINSSDQLTTDTNVITLTTLSSTSQ